MVYTPEQWTAIQAKLPVEDREPYSQYVATLSDEEQRVVYLASLTPVERRKILEAEPAKTAKTAVVDEQTKRAGAAADVAGQKTATATKASAAEIQSALNALTAGRVLTDAQKALLNIGTTPPPTKSTFTPIELQGIVAKLGRGEQLTAEEAAAIGSTVTPTVVTTAGPSVVTTAGPNVVTTTGSPNIVTTTGSPNIVTTTAGPNIVTTTAGPNVVTTTGSPNIVTTTTKPDVVTTAGPSLTTQPPGGLTYTATDGTVFTDQLAYVQYQKFLTDGKLATDATKAAGLAERQSAYDLLYAQFSAYGLGSLVEPLKGLIQSGASPAEFALRLRNDNSINPATGRPWNEAYKKRFSANDLRINKGLKAISEAEYLGLEDQYQNILRNAGLPESYWKRGDLGVQEGFTNFIANDVSAVELEDRVSTAQQRVLFANPEVSIALKTFYPDISNGDLLAYALDPTKGLDQIKRRITAAEIGSSAVQMGLASNVTDAEYLARYGVNKAQAQQGYRTAAEILPTASKLGDIYARQGLGPYTQQTAEQEIFNVPGAAEAAAKRRKLTELETASFSGRAGMGALARDRAGAF